MQRFTGVRRVLVALAACFVFHGVADATVAHGSEGERAGAPTERILAPERAHLFFFPPPGESLDQQDQREPSAVGLRAGMIAQLRSAAGGARWALWRHGYLVHVEGDFNALTEVKSLRKTWHALTVGAAIQQGKIPSLDQRLSAWCPELTGKDAEATWRHVIAQTSGFDYPSGDFPAYRPGEIWTYSDKNPHHLCNALARVYGKRDYSDGYDEVVREAYFDAIGMRGWRTSVRQDGVRFHFDLEDLGRLGLFVLAGGNWDGRQLISQEFVEALQTKQTRGVLVNYRGPDDGDVGLNSGQFPEAPYGFMTWVNTDGDFYPGADRSWALGRGAGGSCVLWNRRQGIVFAGFNIDLLPTDAGFPHVIEDGIEGPNPLARAQAAAPGHAPAAAGRYAKWEPIELSFDGPDSRSRGEPNPFVIVLNAAVTSPSGKTYRVPGFYDGDGGGGLDGNVWKVRFSADEEGEWTFVTSSTEARLDGRSGRLTVTGTPDDAAGFWKWGRLEAIGTAENAARYLRFRDGPYWLKAGCDDPESFLGAYENYNSLAKRRAAIEYLAERGINSQYIMTHNIGGDDGDVWPWLGDTPRAARTNAGPDGRFDVVKLRQWRALFEYMQHKGVVVYLVLEDDSAWTGYDHDRYYRELIARFGDLPGLVFNIGEEANENYRLPEALALAARLKQIDPYDHPVAIHNVNQPRDEYIDAPQIDLTSIQTGSLGVESSVADAMAHNRLAIQWIERCRLRERRILTVNFDEGRPELNRRSWWSAYLGGGVWEAHVLRPYDRPHSTWEPVWTELGGTRAFMESLPFWEMEPHNELVLSGSAFCLAKPGAVYALYLPTGGSVTVNLAPDITYEADWWNPANGSGGRFQETADVERSRRQFTPPGPGDWALRIRRKSSSDDR